MGTEPGVKSGLHGRSMRRSIHTLIIRSGDICLSRQWIGPYFVGTQIGHIARIFFTVMNTFALIGEDFWNVWTSSQDCLISKIFASCAKPRANKCIGRAEPAAVAQAQSGFANQRALDMARKPRGNTRNHVPGRMSMLHLTDSSSTSTCWYLAEKPVRFTQPAVER